jgi:hypothetical protein
VPEYQFDHDGREPVASTRRRAAGVSNRCLPVNGETAFPGDGGQLARVSMIYEGQSFVMTDCRDWTNIVVEQTPSKPPAWPVSALNLLKNFHFSGGSVGVLEGWNTSGLAHASLQVSTTKEDTTKNTPKPLRGVTYLRLDCRAGCPNEVLYQDIPLDSPARRSDAYTLGVIGRSEAGPGSLSFSLTQLDHAGHVLAASPVQVIDLSPEQTRCDKTGKRCQQFIYNPAENAGSVVLSSNFASRTVPVSLNPHATTLRFSIAPASANAFNIVSAWLMRSP